MQTTFNASPSGQAIIQNTTAAGIEKLVVNLHPGNDSVIDIQIKEETPGDGMLVSSTISINQDGMQKLVEWLRDQGAIQ
ncbi:hypothetical protein [Noviherbaspirillum denitrificans]|uniref:Uncharacterized protein n=1 Tax=Noviherbaspirillum denitrificans TaxID=1968433 RepID=A0A254TMP1_9BURK|nr:hypothetical protein [Noviherbaspirillum denitrificans]OWW21893.1 hypothetical protein AYR66_22760 [Noviherbaspirillum denitrificans]